MKKLKTIFILGILLFACKSNTENKPNEILSKEKMVDIIIDKALYQSAIGLQSKTGKSLDKIHYRDIQFIFNKYKTTDSIFEKSMQWYENHPNKLLTIYHTAEAKIGKIKFEDTTPKADSTSKILMDSLQIVEGIKVSDLGDSTGIIIEEIDDIK